MPSAPDPAPKRRATDVRVVSCHAARCGGASGCSPRAVLTFSAGIRLLDPYLLSVTQIHVLVRDLLRVLSTLDDDGDRTHGVTTANGLPLPPIPTAPTPKAKPSKRLPPSRRPTSPTGPIQHIDVWQLHSMLKNVKSHDDFMRLIGAEAVADDPEVSGGVANATSSPLHGKKPSKEAEKAAPSRRTKKRKEK